ncbi:hypothetical protein KDA_71070 [Dictyobacter alpinus]|uniref:Uncharacterized protein n=1 Tax=Dictyobacter alpinus TaxID=2014873 RepID=A0A402BJV7_9CHLR|nr:hypothetical protein [Dictyobacter alpinus]GCE31623.1 hypothetical protein KDA_71070 [Dictyobacter alpinus]
MTQDQQTWSFGTGSVTCDLNDGSVVNVQHLEHPGMNFLLNEQENSWHQAPFRWGKGFLLTNEQGARWNQPQTLTVNTEGLDCTYQLLPSLTLKVSRLFGQHWSETYTLTNTGTTNVDLTSVGISTPFRDLYTSAQESLSGHCHAHIWTGGAYSYAWAWPMRGTGPGLGLALTQGELWSYSIASRNYFTGSQIRGHIYLHLTDRRTPHAMGGQPALQLQAGASLSWSWTLDWFEDFASFSQTLLAPPVELPRLTAQQGEPLLLKRLVNTDVQLILPHTVQASRLSETTTALQSNQAGIAHIDLQWEGKRARVGLLFHRPLREIVEQRIHFLLANQRATERGGTAAAAFVPYDTRWHLRSEASNWSDWSDARERICMPILLQHARMRDWGEKQAIDEALHAFTAFCRHYLITPDNTVLGDSFQDATAKPRLYNFPWFVDYFLNQYHLYGQNEDGETACSILERYYTLGGEHFLAIGIAESTEAVIQLLREQGQQQRAEQLRARLLAHADYMLALGANLPAHEVNYEQSIVAPLLQLLISAQRLNPSEKYIAAIKERLPWLLAFAGPQPHARLRHIAIRHWDGYWFGALRLWGDTFPHYWSVLNAAVLLRLPEEASMSEATTIAHAILDANLVNFNDDGSATCAFVYPSCVDGNPAHVADPLANDQDWALVYALQYQRG